MRFFFAFVLACGAAIAQPAGAISQFEVASVRPDGPVFRPGPGSSQGGPGTADPVRITYNFATLKMLVMQAYSMQDFQVFGPDWIESERYTITAKLPPGSTKEHVRTMLQNLIEERFKLKIHHETKILPVYELTVGKSGSKMRVSPDDAKPLTTADYAELKYVDGIPQYPPGRIGSQTAAGVGIVMMSAAHQPISSLVSFLQSRLRVSSDDRKPVIDKTGLTGNYDFALKFTPPMALLSASPNNGPRDPSLDVFAAVQQYLGLKLEEKKNPLDTMVIDHAEKVPEEN